MTITNDRDERRYWIVRVRWVDQKTGLRKLIQLQVEDEDAISFLNAAVVRMRTVIEDMTPVIVRRDYV